MRAADAGPLRHGGRAAGAHRPFVRRSRGCRAPAWALARALGPTSGGALCGRTARRPPDNSDPPLTRPRGTGPSLPRRLARAEAPFCTPPPSPSSLPRPVAARRAPGIAPPQCTPAARADSRPEAAHTNAAGSQPASQPQQKISHPASDADMTARGPPSLRLNPGAPTTLTRPWPRPRLGQTFGRPSPPPLLLRAAAVDGVPLRAATPPA
jgi:hypothetical protein